MFFFAAWIEGSYLVKSTISGTLLRNLPKLKQIIPFMSLLQDCVLIEHQYAHLILSYLFLFCTDQGAQITHFYQFMI